jgi:hypothetical protein
LSDLVIGRFWERNRRWFSIARSLNRSMAKWFIYG